MLELYNSPVSTCSQNVRIVLAEKGIDWTDRRISFKDKEHLSEAYLKLNPNGVVPTLVHDGRPVVDSSVINEYLEDLHPEPHLVPTDAYERARMRAWRQYIDEVPTPSIRVPSFNAFVRHIWGPMSEQDFLDFSARLPLRKHFFRRMGPEGFPKHDMDEALEKLRATLERAEASLADGPWLCGDMFTLADISLTPSIVRMEDLGLAHMWSGLPRFADWFRRVQARPSFAIAYYPGTRQLSPSC